MMVGSVIHDDVNDRIIIIDKDLWICKPTGANQGKGIFLVRELKPFLARLEDDKKACKYGAARIVQRYH